MFVTLSISRSRPGTASFSIFPSVLPVFFNFSVLPNSYADALEPISMISAAILIEESILSPSYVKDFSLDVFPARPFLSDDSFDTCFN